MPMTQMARRQNEAFWRITVRTGESLRRVRGVARVARRTSTAARGRTPTRRFFNKPDRSNPAHVHTCETHAW